MTEKYKIKWTKATWNPATKTPIHQGAKSDYAWRLTEQFKLEAKKGKKHGSKI